MRKTLSWPVALIATVAIGLTVAPVPAASAAPVAASTTTERDRKLRERIAQLLPANHRARIAALEDRLNVTDGDLRELAENVIDPDDYVCEDTELFRWLDASIADWTADDVENVLLVLTLNLVFLDALLFPEPARERFFGMDGEYTGKLQRSFRTMKRFWDIDGSGIELVPAHGSVLLDTARMTRLLTLALELPEAEAAEVAAALAVIVDQPQYDHGDHPLFTFNAFAYDSLGEEIPGVGVPTNKVLMGDGMLEGFRAIGLSDVAPNAVLGHEYGHHIQFQRNLFESPLTGPEATRRTELMADSFGSYYVSHRKGDNLRWHRSRKVLETFYNIGDCFFEDPNHHGTPNQRMRAADWGADLAVRSRGVHPTLKFARLFEKKLPVFVAPDAG
ncbi:hypothetical protein [Paractinoplanes rishiriensis]|uniref:Uncharacterized protein n=1 Tax=Paractinoplanes rishiriensis TaxID=1050105 RepID=A0A919K5X5_9ACTN|nr:hypothetical protein [Actinoplanes rishiriensis]GIF00724.1 hypothetical protein Ari01nite_81880 [Actinoplanes rishiriensis]